MSANKSIKTTGELRDFLATMMVGVKNGDLDLDKARNITKLAGQINESFYAEVKVAKVRAEAGAIMPALGEMLIGEDAKK
jgi:hypothetical protein